MERRIIFWLVGAFVAVTLIGLVLPLALSFSAGAIASAAGCNLNESQVHSCLVWGYDIGSLLASMFVLGWFAVAGIGILLVAAPVVALAILALGVTAFVRKRTKHSH